MIRTIRSFAHNESGATSIEYGVIAVVIAVVILVALNAVSVSVDEGYEIIAGVFE